MKDKLLLSVLLFSTILFGCSINNETSSNLEVLYKLEEPTISYSEVLDSTHSNYYGNYEHLKSVGDQKILVIPVDFVDYPSSLLEGGEEYSLKRIEDTFFGKSEDTAWESVSSYYQKSSYGKLNLEGKVSPWFHTNKTIDEVKKTKEEPTWSILREAVKWYKSNFDDICDFDVDLDGYIDAVWLVYSAPFSLTGDDLLWAYTYWDYEAESDFLSPNANIYSWASYYFTYEGNYDLTDSHTFIHETGHLFGLVDYYTYDVRDWGPTGLLDMMDGNIGDHNGYSKGILGWTYPYVATGKCQVTLRPFESSGDYLIIPASFNGSMFDEYLLLEYYTPTGLNYFDSLKIYPNSSRMFTTNGVKVYHVDARLGVVKYNMQGGWKFSSYTDKILSTTNSYTQIAASNTMSTSLDNNKLIHLLESSGNNTLRYGRSASATNAMLFKQGDSFGKKTFNGFKFNEGKFGFTFDIVSMNEENVIITVNKK